LERPRRALIFDLDGTLVDTVYAHVFAWQRAFAEVGLPIDGWRIHRRVGMSGGLFARAAAREIGRPLSTEEADALQRRHGELFLEVLPERRALPGAVELFAELQAEGIPHGIATSGRRPEIDASLEVLGVGEERRPSSSSVDTSIGRNRSRISFSPVPSASASRPRTATSSATPSGTCSPPGVPEC